MSMEPAYLDVAPGEQGVFVDPGLDGAHDPTVVRDVDGGYVMVSTDTAIGAPGAGVQVRLSDDLVTWRWGGHAFDGVPEPARAWSGAQGLWAPEVVRRGDEFRMYHSASTFGSRTSAISLATAPTARGPWRDRGVVVRTEHDASSVNAIDAAVTIDSEGRDWLFFGSFFGGLRVLPLGVDGTPVREGDLGQPVARRAASINGAIEGSHALWSVEHGHYYLFTSFDSLFDTYHVRVARSRAITGDYQDAQVRSMIDDREPPTRAGNLLLGSHVDVEGRTWVAPGHSSHLIDGDRAYLVHHVRYGQDHERPTTQIRQLAWTATGWPVVSPVPFGGTVDRTLEAPDAWVATRFVDDVTDPVAPRPAEVALGSVGADDRVTVSVDGEEMAGVVFRDMSATGPRFSVSALDRAGQAVWLQGAQ